MTLGAESWYIASGTQDLQICLDNDPELTFNFYGKVIRFYVYLYGGNVDKSF